MRRVMLSESLRAKEFTQAMQAHASDVLGGHPAAFFLASFEEGVEEMTHMVYREEGTPFFTGRTLPRPVVDLFMDIPDDLEPDLAAVSAVVATYHAPKREWSIGVAFGEDAAHWRIVPGGVHDLASEVCPL